MDQQSLASLREKILGDIVPLVINASGEGRDKFGIILRIIQAGNAPRELYDKAYEAAHSIEDSNERLDALMSLLDEVDLDMAPVPTDDQPAEQLQNNSADDQPGESYQSDSSDSEYHQQ